MLSLVNYGSSDSENESEDEETVQKGEKAVGEVFSVEALSRKLPQPSTREMEIAEENDEFLLKKAVPTVLPPKRGKVKIMIPRLSDLKNDDDDDEVVVKRTPAVNKKSGLLSMLPRPSQSFAPAPRPVKHQQNNTLPGTKPSADPATTTEAPKKVGFVPYALMSHKPKAPALPPSKKQEESDDEGDPESFFTFDTKIEELPKVSDDEVRALVAKESERLELRKRQGDDLVMDESYSDHAGQYVQNQQHSSSQDFDAEAMKALMGGNKAKRSKIDNIQIIDLSASEVLPNRDEWLRKTLAGETSYMPTGNIVDKGPTALSKRKHQISYLSMRAESNEAELEAMWASNRQTKRESKSKYGF